MTRKGVAEPKPSRKKETNPIKVKTTPNTDKNKAAIVVLIGIAFWLCLRDCGILDQLKNSTVSEEVREK